MSISQNEGALTYRFSFAGLYQRDGLDDQGIRGRGRSVLLLSCTKLLQDGGGLGIGWIEAMCALQHG